MYAFDPNEEDRNESFLWCYGWKEACTHSFMFVSILLNGQLFVWMLYTEYTRYNSNKHVVMTQWVSAPDSDENL